MYYNSYELYHHGVKGQKWGVRKEKGSSAPKAKTKKSLSPRTKQFLKNAAILAGTLAVGTMITKAQTPIANTIYSIRTKSKKGKKRTESILERMGPVIVNKHTGKVVDDGSLKNYTLDDLSKLDLY